MDCILYKNTGFNTVNIPDKPSLLNENASIHTSVIDCLQERFLKNISVQIEWKDVKDVDYCSVDGFYYYVTNVRMTSYDVAELSLNPDFITSAGGPLNLKIIGGITERHHVAKNSDIFGSYDEEDPLCNPNEPLNVVVDTPIMSSKDSSDVYSLVESSIDLYKLGEKKENGTLESETYTDPANSSIQVTVPSVPETVGTTQFQFFAKEDSLVPDQKPYTTTTVGTCLFMATNRYVQIGIATARALGVENAIIAQWQIPKNDSITVQTADAQPGRVTAIIAEQQTVEINTKVGIVIPGPGPQNMAFRYYSYIRNNRVFIGENSRYGLLTASGDSTEATPEILTVGGTNEQLQSEAPQIIYCLDPRHDGRPYFNFLWLRFAYNGYAYSFFRNAIGGMEWRNLPLRFIEPSNSILNSYNQKSQSYRETSAHRYAQSQNSGFYDSPSVPSPETASGLMSGKSLTAGLDATQLVINGILSLATNIRDTRAENARFKLQRQSELYNYSFPQSVVEPEIKFPYQQATLRDFLGNVCIPYRYFLSATDAQRIDKLLTAYGYKITEMLDSSMFNNRPKFNYVEANYVSVGNNLPTWWKDGITAQFGTGVRIWHVKPDEKWYENNGDITDTTTTN